MPPARLTPGDLAVAMLLALGAAWLYATCSLGRIYGNDGAMLAEWTALPERAFHHYHNTLYLPAARVLDALLPRGLLAAADDPLALAKSLSAVSAALGLTSTYACCRQLGGARLASAAGTLLLAVSPVTWFFAAAIEVHALHFAVVSFCAFVTLAAPWQRPVLATALTAIVFVLPYLSHQSAPVLGPGWLLLVQAAKKRSGEPFPIAVLFWIGTALLLSLALGSMLVHWRRGMGFTIDVALLTTTIGDWRRAFTPSIVWTAFLEPLLLLVPIALVAACWRAIDGWLRACAAATMVPLVACVLWWGIPERGGYLLGPSFLLAALAAALWSRLPRALAVTTAIAAIAIQASAGLRFVRHFDREGSQLVDRVAVVRDHLGPQGQLLSSNDNAPNIAAWLPAVQELNLLGTLANDTPIDAWFPAIWPVVQDLASKGRFALDTSYRLRTDMPDRVIDAMARLEAALRRDYRVTEHPHASWPLWIVEPR